MRIDGRANDQLRPVHIKLGYQQFAEGSALIEVGLTKVICSVTIEERVPPFLRGGGKGWVTAEYGMLPRSTHTRSPRERESAQGRASGRTYEIQRLIGRSLRAVINLEALGERTLIIDCDVLQADGGTRTAAITGAYVALRKACRRLIKHGVITRMPISKAVAAASVGIVNGEEMLDLCFEEDSHAEVDFNVVMTSDGEFVEIQGTAEVKPFPRRTVDSLLTLAEKGIRELFAAQQEVLERLSVK